MKIVEFIKIVKRELPSLVVSRHKKLSELTTFSIGGKIGAYAKVYDRKTMLKLLALIKQYRIKYFVLGRGSNLLASDKFHDIFVLHVCLDKIFCYKDKIICDGGVGLFRLNTFAIEHGLSGLEWSYGIPGSLGGAVHGNAGSFSSDMSQVVQYVYYTDGKTLCRKSARDLDFSYRKSYFSDKNYVILRVVLQLKKKNKEEVKALCDYNFARKKALQPYEERSAGSVFKRPKGNFAPILIEKCNLKGIKRGYAQISTKHCGFIVNLKGKACFREVYSLICLIKRRIYKFYKVSLEEEIVILK